MSILLLASYTTAEEALEKLIVMSESCESSSSIKSFTRKTVKCSETAMCPDNISDSDSEQSSPSPERESDKTVTNTSFSGSTSRCLQHHSDGK